MQKPIIRYNPFYARKRPARQLRSLFKDWDRLLHWANGYMKHPKWPDLPFWYGERSNIGWLALAAYRKGWLPLQEASINRSKRYRYRGKQKRRQAKGRGDLLIYKGHGLHQKIYDFEAKEADLSLDSLCRQEPKFSFDKDIHRKLTDALKSTKNKSENEWGHIGHFGVGVVFLRLYLPRKKKRTTNDLRKALGLFQRKIKSDGQLESVGADFIALHLALLRSLRR